jgi:hypothetical protein
MQRRGPGKRLSFGYPLARLDRSERGHRVAQSQVGEKKLSKAEKSKHLSVEIFGISTNKNVKYPRCKSQVVNMWGYQSAPVQVQTHILPYAFVYLVGNRTRTSTHLLTPFQPKLSHLCPSPCLISRTVSSPSFAARPSPPHA